MGTASFVGLEHLCLGLNRGTADQTLFDPPVWLVCLARSVANAIFQNQFQGHYNYAAPCAFAATPSFSGNIKGNNTSIK